MRVKKNILDECDPLNEKFKEKSHEDTEGTITTASILQEDISTSEETNENNDKNGDAVESKDLDEAFFDFQLFIKQLKYPQADPIIRYTRSFLHNFCTQRPLWTASEQVKLINDFKLFIYEKYRMYEPFKSLNDTQFKNAQEGMEKLIMGKLYFRCFSPFLKQSLKIDMDEEHGLDLIDDIKLNSKIKEYRFIEIENLDTTLKEINSLKLTKFIELGCNELNKINKFKSPRDKIICILNCCKVIYGLLKHSQESTHGADSFVPLLIYIVLKSDTEHLISNIRYIERFRFVDLNKGEELYYLSSLQGAIKFIETLTMDSLNANDHDAFNTKYLDNQTKLKEETQRKIEEEQKQIKEEQSQKGKETMPTLDDVTTSMATMFNDFVSSYSGSNENNNNLISENNKPVTTITSTPPPPPTLHRTRTEEETREEERVMSKLIERLEVKEKKDTLEKMQTMFPDLDKEIIEDVCVAKKYNIGECVDTLLTLFN
ncbi:vacuolar protein sorting-associated protein 9 [Monosporozyma unispora]|nr:hypothetical protein C6P44_003019 [Kazachstania unispora]